MTALWVQINVLSDRGKSLPLNVLPRWSKGCYHGLGPPSVLWERAALLMCEEGWVQHRLCLSCQSCFKFTKWREGKVSHRFEHSDRSWIRYEGNPGVELMLLITAIPNTKTSVLVVDMGNSHSEKNGKRVETTHSDKFYKGSFSVRHHERCSKHSREFVRGIHATRLR